VSEAKKAQKLNHSRFRGESSSDSAQVVPGIKNLSKTPSTAIGKEGGMDKGGKGKQQSDKGREDSGGRR